MSQKNIIIEQSIIKSILFVCFDINSTYEENEPPNDKTENLPEDPNRILTEFFSNHSKLNMEKTELKSSEIKYKFILNLSENINFNLITMKNLSFIHEISLEAEAFLIFINLESEKTPKNLEKLITYISDGVCSIETQTYVVGLYTKDIIPSCSKEELENIFDEKNLNYEFYQIEYDMNDEDNKEHNCLLENVIENNDKHKKKNKQIIKSEKDEYNLQEIIEKIIINIYEIKMSVIYEPDNNKFVKKKDKNVDKSKSRCNII